MEERICPNGWDNCWDCMHEIKCRAGLYHGETIVEVAKIVEKQIDKEVAESVKIIKGLQSEVDFWGWWGRSSPPNLHSKTPLPLDGPSSPGGGGKCRVPKKPQKKVPEYMKFLGM